MSTIYLDMDGVIADFFSALEELHGVDHWKSIKDKHTLISSIAYTDFFYHIKPFETTFDLIKNVKELSGGDWGICSSPLEGDYNNSAYWKRRWLEKYDIMPSTDKLIFTRNKHKYAWSTLTGKKNILVDDKPSNVKRWKDAGGVGIRYQANEDDLNEYLLFRLDKEVEVIRRSIGHGA